MTTGPLFVTAYDTSTGEILPHPVPAHWFDHPVLGANLSKTPRQKAADKARKGTTAPASGEGKGKEA